MDKVFSKENKTLKKYWKIGKKILEKSGKSQGILSVRKSGNPVEYVNNTKPLCNMLRDPNKNINFFRLVLCTGIYFVQFYPVNFA